MPPCAYALIQLPMRVGLDSGRSMSGSPVM
jgi:hypothetical protein